MKDNVEERWKWCTGRWGGRRGGSNRDRRKWRSEREETVVREVEPKVL